jgi:uncharacterized protein (TIRG00374 family)
MEHHHLISSWRFKSLLLTIIAAMLGYFLFILWGGWHQVVLSSYKVGLAGTVAALVLSLLNIFLRFLRWKHFIAIQGYPIPFATHLRIYLAGFALTPTPAKTGEALRSVFLADYHVPYRVSFGVFLSERFSDLLSVGVISGLGLWYIPNFRWIVWLMGTCLILFLLSLQQIQWIRAIEDFFKRKLSLRFARFIEFVFQTILSFQNCFSLNSLLFGTALGVIAWSAHGLAFYYILKLMGAEISFFWANYIYAVSLLIGSMTFLPGGIGGTEVAMVQFLVYQNVSLPTAIAATVFIRFATLWFSVLIGILALPLKKLLCIK